MFLISVVPLTFNTSPAHINSFIDNINAQNFPCELVVVLESNDSQYWQWKASLKRLSFGCSYHLDVLPEGYSSKGACLNLAISIAKGEFIMRCDMDDFILSSRMSDFLLAYESSPICDVYYSDMFSYKKRSTLTYPSPTYLALYSIFRNPIPAPTVFINRKSFLKYGLSYPSQNLCEDLSIVLQLIDRKASFFKLPRPTVVYSSNNIYRSSSNWVANAYVRLRRRRLDLIGLCSFLVGIHLLILVTLFHMIKNSRCLVRTRFS